MIGDEAVRLNLVAACAGPAEELGSIIEDLQKEGVFVRGVETLGLAYHSPALDPLLPFLKQGEEYWKIGRKLGDAATCQASDHRLYLRTHSVRSWLIDSINRWKDGVDNLHY